MPSFLPSEIGRLIYGYLLTECNEGLANEFLNSCDSLRECQQQKQRGRRFYATVQDLTLMSILNQYSILSSMIFENLSDEDRVHRNLLHLFQNLLRSKLGVTTNYCESESTFHTPTTSVHHQPIRKVSDLIVRGNTEIGNQCTANFANRQMKQNDNIFRDASTSTDDLHGTCKIISNRTRSSAIDLFRQSNNSVSNINDSFFYSRLKNQDSVNPENTLLNTVRQSPRKNQKLIDGTSTSSLNVFLHTPKKDGVSDDSESIVLPSSFHGTPKSLSPSKSSDQLVSDVNIPFMKSYDCSSIVTEAQNIGSKNFGINPTSKQVLISNNDLLKTSTEQARNHFDTLTLSANKLLLSPSVKSDNAIAIQTGELSKSQYNEIAMSNETFQTTNQQDYHYHHNQHSTETHNNSPAEQTAWENNIATSTEKSYLVISSRHTPPKVKQTEATSTEYEKANCEGRPLEASSNDGMFPEMIASNDKVALPKKIINSKKTCLINKNPVSITESACAVHKKSVSDSSFSSSANKLHRTAEVNAACVDKEQVKNLDSSSELNELQKTDFSELKIPILNHNYETMVSHYHTPAKIRPSVLPENRSTKDFSPNESKTSIPWDYNLRQSLVDDVQNSINTSKPVEKCKKNRTPRKKRKTDETRDEKLIFKKFKTVENACINLTKSNTEAKESNLRLNQSKYGEKIEVTNNDCKGRSPHQIKGGDNKSKNNLLTEIGKKRISKSCRESDIGKVREVKIENNKTKEELNSRSELSKVREVVKENADEISVDATIDDGISDKSDLISKGIVVKEMNICQLSENQTNENNNNGREVNVKSLHGNGKASIKLSKTQCPVASSKSEVKQTRRPNCKVPLVGEIATRSPDIPVEIIHKTNTIHDTEKIMPVKLQRLDSVKNIDILNNYNNDDNDNGDDENWQARLKMTEEIVLLHKISSEKKLDIS